MTSRRVMIAAIVAAAAALWLPHIARSLWLDETGTYWVVSGDVQDTVDRATRFQGQSPVFFVIEWIARVIGQGNEIVLRLPSLLSMATAALLLYRLAVRLVGDRGALVGVASFVTSWKIVNEAIDARPYAFGLMIIVGSMLALVRWLESGRTRDGVIYVVLAALMMYAHYLFGVLFLVHAVYGIEARRRGTPVSVTRMVVGAAGIAVLLLPLVPQFLAVLSKRGTYSWAGTPSFGQLAVALVPPVTAAGLVIGLLAARVIVRARIGRPTRPPAFLLLWLVVSPLVFFAISRFTSTKIFAAQYVIASEPAVALLAAWYLRDLAPALAAPIVAASLAITTAGSHYFRPQVHEDWRGAVAEINSLRGNGPVGVMCACGFVESSHLEWLTDPERRAFLNAPLAAYPPDGSILRLPGDLNDDALRDYANAQVAQFIASRDRVAFLSRGDTGYWDAWLAASLEAKGFERQPTGQHPGVGLLVFQRRRSP